MFLTNALEKLEAAIAAFPWEEGKDVLQTPQRSGAERSAGLSTALRT